MDYYVFGSTISDNDLLVAFEILDSIDFYQLQLRYDAYNALMDDKRSNTAHKVLDEMQSSEGMETDDAYELLNTYTAWIEDCAAAKALVDEYKMKVREKLNYVCDEFDNKRKESEMPLVNRFHVRRFLNRVSMCFGREF